MDTHIGSAPRLLCRYVCIFTTTAQSLRWGCANRGYYTNIYAQCSMYTRLYIYLRSPPGSTLRLTRNCRQSLRWGHASRGYYTKIYAQCSMYTRLYIYLGSPSGSTLRLTRDCSAKSSLGARWSRLLYKYICTV